MLATGVKLIQLYGRSNLQHDIFSFFLFLELNLRACPIPRRRLKMRCCVPSCTNLMSTTSHLMSHDRLSMSWVSVVAKSKNRTRVTAGHVWVIQSTHTPWTTRHLIMQYLVMNGYVKYPWTYREPETNELWSLKWMAYYNTIIDFIGVWWSLKLHEWI